jgi:cob(I)alamin adenosyltransferase
MKRLVLFACTTMMLWTAVPLPAVEQKGAAEKDLCLLYSQNCAYQAESIQEKIAHLQAEIAKGTRVYSQEEIKRLEEKLKEAEDLLEDLLYSPSRGRSHPMK